MNYARILYLVAAEGNGHATRSAAVIERLRERGHEVVAVSEGNALAILEPVCDKVIEAATPHMEYRKNSVAAIGTLITNLINLPRFIRDLKRIRMFAQEFNPDIIISDFNPMSRFIRGPPVISIDNQCIITKGDIEIPRGWWLECIKSRFVVRAFTKRSKVRLITSFFDAPIRIDSVRIGPIVSRKTRSAIPKDGRHLLVYQTSRSNQALADLLPKLDVEIRAYGFGRVGRAGKTAFMPFDRERWFKDLVSCKAVIINGGFSLITEALILKKPILCFPIDHQFEQALNAHYLHKDGLGIWAGDLSKKEIERFIKTIPSIKSAISQRIWEDGAMQAADFIDRFISEHVSR